MKDRTPPPPFQGLTCAYCLGARLFGEYGGRLAELSADRDHGGEPVTIWKGDLCCLSCFNKLRGFPAEFPNAELAAGVEARLIDQFTKGT